MSRPDTHGISTGTTDSQSELSTSKNVTGFGTPNEFTARDGTVSGVAFDSLGRVVQAARPDPVDGFIPPYGPSGCVRNTDGTFPPAGGAQCPAREFSLTSIVYCDVGGPVDANRVAARTDAAGIVVEYWYDVADQCAANGVATPQKTVRAAGTSEEATSYVTTVDGLVISATDPDGIVTTNHWDADRNLLSTTVGTSTTFYGYDPYGRRVVIRQPDGTETWVDYDVVGRPERAYLAAPGPARVCYDSGGVTPPGQGEPAVRCDFPATIDLSPIPAFTETSHRLDGSTRATVDAAGGDRSCGRVVRGGQRDRFVSPPSSTGCRRRPRRWRHRSTRPISVAWRRCNVSTRPGGCCGHRPAWVARRHAPATRISRARPAWDGHRPRGHRHEVCV